MLQRRPPEWPLSARVVGSRTSLRTNLINGVSKGWSGRVSSFDPRKNTLSQSETTPTRRLRKSLSPMNLFGSFTLSLDRACHAGVTNRAAFRSSLTDVMQLRVTMRQDFKVAQKRRVLGTKY